MQSLSSLSVLTFTPILRRYAYEAFLNSHLPLAVLLGGTLWSHVGTDRRFSHILLLTALGCFFAGWLCRFCVQLFHNVVPRRRHALTRVLSSDRHGGTLVLKLELPRTRRILPGQYVYLTLWTTRALSFLQRHPFVITWWESPYYDQPTSFVWIMVDPRRGWTQRIMRHSQALVGVKAWLDGPYGQVHKLEAFGSVLLFASGTGIFALLPMVKTLAELVKASAANTRRIKLVWHTIEYHDQVQIWMQSLLDDYELDTGVSSCSQTFGTRLTFGAASQLHDTHIFRVSEAGANEQGPKIGPAFERSR